MSARFSVSVLVLALCALVASCASIPKKASEDDCLVIMKTTLDNPELLTTARKYSYSFSPPTYGTVSVPKSNSYVAVVVKEPAVRLTRLSSRIDSAGGFVGADGSYDVDFTLPYSPGKVVIADFVFLERLSRRNGSSIEDFIDFRPITDEERTDLEAELTRIGVMAWQD